MIDFDHIFPYPPTMPRVAQRLIDRRRRRMTLLLRDHAYLPVAALCRRFGISQATARRDLTALSRQKHVVRAFGGAVADYDHRFAPFADRLKIAAAAKAAIAAAALELIRPGATVFLDAGTTLYAVADLLRRRALNLRVVTNSLAVAEALARTRSISVDLLGGRMLPNQSVLLGPQTCRAANFYRFDIALLGAEGFDATGVWNSDPDVTALQQAVIARAARHAMCLDKLKLGRTAPALLARWEQVDLLITDAQADELMQIGAKLPSGQIRSV
jgi:DeoR family fructose operon transcriptional repressor